jgi:hypothetical protein
VQRGRGEVDSARGYRTYDVGMIEALEDPHLAPHAFLISLYFLLRNRLQRDVARDVDRLGRRGLRGGGKRGGGGGLGRGGGGER